MYFSLSVFSLYLLILLGLCTREAFAHILSDFKIFLNDDFYRLFFIDLKVYKNRRKANYKILNVFFYSVVILMSFSMHHRFVPVHVLEKPEFCCLHALQIPKLLRLSYE